MSIASGTESYQRKFLNINTSKELKKGDYYNPRSPREATFSTEIEFLSVPVIQSIIIFCYFVYCSFTILLARLPTTCFILLRINMLYFLEWETYLFENRRSAVLFISFCMFECMWTCICIYVSTCTCNSSSTYINESCLVSFSISFALLLRQSLTEHRAYSLLLDWMFREILYLKKYKNG